MSSVDDRVVRMEFDNKQFESGVSTTMSTLQKLNEALKFRGAAAGFDDVQRASASLNFAPLNDSLWQVQQNFSFFGEFVRTVFDRISNQIINLGSTMVRELTTAPLKAGFDEYQLQMNSTQTIMASTGKSIDEVTGYLDQLNTYADKTIYSFSDMTANIGKFTNAGVDLDVAVKAIQGISNEAAVSGANAQEASRAMYNFAQALSAGYVKLIDWKSIENANMATKEFKEQLLETAVAVGTVEKTADGMYRVLTSGTQGGTMGEAIDATHLFNDSLSYQWMTTDVLTQTLAKYADETTEIGKKAFAAATEVKTFSQLIDTVKESLGSGWTKSFTYVIGNLEEAKVLWTGVNNEINAILDPIAEAREEMLKFWHDNGGRDKAIQAISDAFQGLKTIMSTIGDSFERIFPPMTGERLVEITNTIADLAARFKDFATDSMLLSDLSIMFENIFAVIRRLAEVAGSMLSNLSPLIGIFADFGGSLYEAVYWLTLFLGGVAKSEDPLKYFSMNASSLSHVVENVVSGIENLVKALLDFVGIHIEGNPITDIFTKLSEFASKHFDLSFLRTLGDSGQGLIGIFDALRDAISSALNAILSGFGSGVEFIIGIFDGFATSAENTAGAAKDVAESFSGLDSVKTIISSFGSLIAWVGEKVAVAAAWIGEQLPHLFEFLGSQDLRDIILNFNSLMQGGLLLSLKNFLDVLAKGKEEKSGGGIVDTIKGLFGDIPDKIGETFDKLTEALSNFQESIKGSAILKIAIAVGILAGSLALLASIDPNRMAYGIAGIAAAMGSLIGAFEIISMGSSVKPRVISAIASSLIKMAIAVGILSLSVKLLSGLDMESLGRGLIGVGSMIAMLSASAILMSRFGGNMTRATKGLTSFAIAIGLLSLSVRLLSGLDMESLGRGLLGVAALMGAAVIAAIALSKFSGGGKAAKGMVGFAAAIGILVLSVKALAGMNIDELKRGLLGVAGLIAALSVLAIAVGHSSLGVGAAVSILVLVGAIAALGGVVRSLGGMSLGDLAKGLGAVAISITAMVIALKVLQTGSAGMIAGAAAMMVMVVAMRVFVPVLERLGAMDVGDIVKAFLTLGAAFAALVVASVALNGLSPIVLSASMAIAAFGAACGVFGIGIGVASAGIILFATALTTAGAAIVASAGIISTGIISLISAIIVGIFDGITAAAVSILENFGEILAALGVAIHAIGDFIVENIPYVLGVIATLVISVLSLIPTFIPQLVGIIGQFVVALVTTLVAWIPTIASVLVTGVISLINSLANGIRENSEAIFAAVRNLLSSVIELVLTALADIVRLIPGVGDTLAGFIEDGKEGVRQALAPESFESMGTDAMSSATSGIEAGGEQLASAAESVGTEGYNSFADGFTQAGDTDLMGPILESVEGSGADFTAYGFDGGDLYVGGFADAVSTGELPQGLYDELMSAEGLFGDAATSNAGVYSNTVQGYNVVPAGQSLAGSGARGAGSQRAAYESAGSNAAEGFNWSLASPYALSVARQKGAELANAALNSVRTTLDERSPSKKMKKIGRYATEGFVIGIGSLTGSVYKESSSVAQNAIDGIKDSLGEASKYLDDGIDFDPTIRPVMDLSEIQNGVDSMNRLVGNGVPNPSIGVGFGAYPQRIMSSLLSEASGSIGSRGDVIENNTYNLYMDGVRVNDDEGITNRFVDLMYELKLKERGYIG